MTDAIPVVKLDEAGHVCGVTRLPREDGPWVEAPAEVNADPFAYRLCDVNGWVVKTPEECAEFEARHALPEPPDEVLLAELRDKRAAGTLTSADVLDAVGLLLDRL